MHIPLYSVDQSQELVAELYLPEGSSLEGGAPFGLPVVMHPRTTAGCDEGAAKKVFCANFAKHCAKFIVFYYFDSLRRGGRSRRMALDVFCSGVILSMRSKSISNL